MYIFAQPKINKMATVKAIVRTTKKTGTAKIRFRLSDGRSVQLFHRSEICVDVELWDEDKECIKAKKVCPAEYRLSINNQVNERKALVASIYEKHRQTIFDSSDFERLIDEALNPIVRVKRDFFSVYEEYLNRHEMSKTEWKNYKSLERVLYRYQSFLQITEKPKFMLSLNMDREELEDFFDYVKNEYLLIDEYPNIFEELLQNYPLLANVKRKTVRVEQRGSNTTIKFKQRLKTFFNWACSEGYAESNPFEGVTIGNAVYGTPYYITLGERDIIADFDFSNKPNLEAQRDIFIFQCYIGCRVGDLLNLKASNVVGRSIEYIPHKTMKHKPQKISVPLHEKALAILEKYKPVSLDSPLFPFITAQKYNVAIKQIFTLCGICRTVTIINPKTGEPENVPINEVASSHLARRTFVGNLYKQVKDPNLIGKLSGHSEGSRAFARYRDIDEEMKQELINLL